MAATGPNDAPEPGRNDYPSLWINCVKGVPSEHIPPLLPTFIHRYGIKHDFTGIVKRKIIGHQDYFQ